MKENKYSWFGFKVGLVGIIIGTIPIALMLIDEYFGISSLFLDVLGRILAIIAILIVVYGGIKHSQKQGGN